MSQIVAQSVNELQVKLCQQLLADGEIASPRGKETRELLGVSMRIDNPRNRLTTLVERKWSPALAVAELAWHLRGDTDVEALAFYTPRWREFADIDGAVRGSCYGARIFRSTSNEGSQWSNARTLLSYDPQSRRAVLNFRIDEDVSRSSNDVACTNTIQFILRNNKLHAFTNMRSNDVIWGVPYDLFLFTCFQELMAVELGVELGQYYHYASSMHVYEHHYALAKRMADCSGPVESGAMSEMTAAESVYAIAQEESSIRDTGERRRPLVGFEEQCISLLTRHKNLSLAA